MKFVGCLLVAMWSLLGAACAEDPNAAMARLLKGKSVTLIMPVFSQLVRTSYPDGFVPGFEKAQPPHYVLELVPSGENVNNWTQMFTVSGVKGLASQPQVTPKLFLDRVADGFKRACPSSFSSQVVSEDKISGFDAFAAVISCGVSPSTGGKTSETALIVAIKGQADLYTIQWAQRASPSPAPILIDPKKWTALYKKMGPITLCPIITGEKAPYPSCTGSGTKAAG